MFDGPEYIELVNAGVLVDATIEIISGCNLRCKHCYIEKRQRMLSVDDAKIILDKLFDEGTINLTLTGGEVMLHPDFCSIYEYAKKKGFIIEIKTNALLLNEKMLDLFSLLPPEEVNITVYGLSNEEYGDFTGDYHGYDKLRDALSLLEKRKINFSLYVISNKMNYSRIINGDYERFFGEYGLEFAFDNDILGGRNGDQTQLEYRLSSDQMINIEKNSTACMEIMRARYAGIGDDKFECIGGINKIYIDPDCNIHCCLFDEEKSIHFLQNQWSEIRKELKKRNEYINNLYLDSSCASCNSGLLCRRCPLKWNRVIDKEDRCIMAKRRRDTIEESIIDYPTNIQTPTDFRFMNLNLKFPHMALQENEILDSQEFDEQVTDYDVIYMVNGSIVHGHKGKYFYYIPALDDISSNALGIPVGHALKILKAVDNMPKIMSEFEQYKLVSKILEETSLVPKTYSYIAVEMEESTRAFVVDNIVEYSKGSVLLGFEVEHIYKADNQKIYTLDNIQYNSEDINTAIENKLKSLNICGKDLWAGNYFETETGIKLLDIFGWYMNT